jgi:hypothetical protein
MFNNKSIILLSALTISNFAVATLNDTELKPVPTLPKTASPARSLVFLVKMPNTAPTVLISPNWMPMATLRKKKMKSLFSIFYSKNTKPGMNNFGIISSWIVIIFNLFANNAFCADVGGIIRSDTTWTLSDSPYVITNDIQVAYGTTLAIEPGVVINGEARKLIIYGNLNAMGSSSSKIAFNNVNIVPGASTPSNLFIINIQYAQINSGSIYYPTGNAIYGSLILQDSEVNDVPYLYIWYPASDCYIERNVFKNSGKLSIGISDNIKIYIRNNVFYNQLRFSGYEIDAAVENWASYQTSETIVEYNSFLSVDRVALKLPGGYSSARMTAINNYWNTSDINIIDSMIYDANDDLSVADYIVYEPFLTSPHANTPNVTFPSFSISNIGTGNGTVTSVPAGIDCGADCTESYGYATVITLTATPATGSIFSGFSGDADCNDGTVTMDAAKTCIATFTLKTYTVTPSANPATGGTVTPNTAQTVNHGATTAFTVTAKTGYVKSNTVSGTCPQGTWNGNIWTTGAISANCTVIFNFVGQSPTSCTTLAATNISVNSATLNGNVVSNSATATASFELGPTITYGTNVAATPSQVYSSTAVATSANATGLACKTTYHFRCQATNSLGTAYGADKSFTTLATCPPNAWIYPATPVVVVGKPLALDIHVNSNSNSVGAYDFTINFDPTKLIVDTAYQNAAAQCVQGICPGSAALASYRDIIVDNANGNIHVAGFDTTGVGSGNDLQLLVMHFIAKNVIGTTPVNLVTNELTNPLGNPLGGVAKGATVRISPGLCGDSDGNYAVNIVDALSISRYVVGYPPPPTINVNLADVNRSTTATIVDALHIARHAVGLVVVTGTCAMGQPL